MNTIINNLEEKKLVERTVHPVHAHVLETRLTSRGADLLAQADRAAMKIEEQLSGEFKTSEQAALRAMLARCVDILSAAEQSLRPTARLASSRRETVD